MIHPQTRLRTHTVSQLSVFGLCAVVAAVALQLNTYHWEHGGLSFGDRADQPESWAAATGTAVSAARTALQKVGDTARVGRTCRDGRPRGAK